MSRSQLCRLGIAVVLLSIFSFSLANAQQPAPPVPVQIQAPAAAQAQQFSRWSDHILEQWLIVDNQAAIDRAKFAQNKSESEKVRGFAEMMVQDHTDFVNNLRQFHEKHTTPPDAFGTRPTGAAAQARQPAAGFNFVGIKQELGKQCVATFKEEFGTLEGRQFDTCFMGSQVAAHLHMRDTLKVFKRHASPELADLIQQGIDTAEDHLMHAKKMMKEFEGTAETASRPSTTEKK